MFELWSMVQSAARRAAVDRGRGRRLRSHRGLPAPPPAPARRGGDAGPRRRRQGVGGPARLGVLPPSPPTTARPRPTPPCSPCPATGAGVHHRLVRGAAAALPRRVGRSPGRARHRQRPRHDGRPADRAVGRLRARRGVPDRHPARDRRRHGRGRGRRRRRRRHRRHQGGRPGQGRRHVHHHVGSRAGPCRWRSRRRGCGRATRCWCPARSPTTAWP